MSIRYKVVQSHLKDSVSYGKWYGKAVSLGTVTTRQLAEEISHSNARHTNTQARTIAGARPAKASECTRRAYFCAKRAIASISREKSWKVVAKIFTLLLCDLCGLARKKLAKRCSSLAKRIDFFSQSRRVIASEN